MNEALVTKDLVKRYGRGNGLNGFTQSVVRGSVLGLVGRNGAGKTTWMMSVVGFVRLNSGSVDLLGRGPFDAAIHSGRVSILPQDSEPPLEARPLELLVRYGRLQGLSSAEAKQSATELLTMLNLSERLHSPIRTLSHGMRKRVMIAQAFLGHPELVLLDEPMSGLDPVEIDRMRNFILARRGKQTIVISSHNLDDIERLCTHVAFVDGGRVVRTSTVSQLTQETGRVTYRLEMSPDLSSLTQEFPWIKAEWTEKKGELSVGFDLDAHSLASANKELLPKLLPYGVLSVVPGQSLEEAFLSS